MKIRITLSILIIVLIFFTGCTQPENTSGTGQESSQKTIQLQNSITDYSATVEEKLQNGAVITRDVLIKRPSMYRIVDSDDCTTLSNGSVRWSFCNGSNTAIYFADPSVRGFFNDVDYQQLFTRMLNANPGTAIGTGGLGGTRTWLIETTPTRPLSYHLRFDFQTVRLWVDTDTGMILQVQLVPADKKNVGTIRFSNLTVNREIPDDTFTFVPGPGMKIIDQKAGLFVENLEKRAGYTHEATPCTDCPLPIRTPQP